VAISANSYGSVAGVASYVKRLCNSSGTFDTGTKPTLIEVEGFIDQQSAKLNAWLVQSGYSIPVTQASAKLILDLYANLGAAGLAELTQRNAGYGDEENERETEFLKEFMAAKDFIFSGALSELGAATSAASSPIAGLWSGGATSSGQRLRPIFTRTWGGQSPTEEAGPKEPDWVEE
jgi:hypothetical protein